MGLAVASGHRAGGEGEQCRHVVAERNGFRVDSFSLFLVFIMEISLVDSCSSDSLSLIKISNKRKALSNI
jgi:hypothetical protein